MTKCFADGTARVATSLRQPQAGREICFNADTMDSYTSINAEFPHNVAEKVDASTVQMTGGVDYGNNEKNLNRVAAYQMGADTKPYNAYPARAPRSLRDRRHGRWMGMKRCVMPTIRGAALAAVATFSGLFALGHPNDVQAQTAIDAAQELATMLDSATAELNGDNLLSALEGAAEAGQPIALWQLGLMYESGVGVERDQARAFEYFSQIANEHADAPPRSLDADIVAQSFVKMGDYYLHGMPDAGVDADNRKAHNLILHAASYFGDADAQYRVGVLYLDPTELGINPLQSARWLSLAARKGHPGAQARLGDLLVSGTGLEPQPVEGLMWLNLAYRRALGTSDEAWIRELLDSATQRSTPNQVEAAVRAADTIGAQFAEY